MRHHNLTESTNMAKPNSLTAKKKEKVVYPSLYGSHRSMVDEDATATLGKTGRVICVDAGGPYETDERTLDNGLADINRYAGRDSWGTN